jgi:hypothetical protein
MQGRGNSISFFSIHPPLVKIKWNFPLLFKINDRVIPYPQCMPPKPEIRKSFKNPYQTKNIILFVHP